MITETTAGFQCGRTNRLFLMLVLFSVCCCCCCTVCFTGFKSRSVNCCALTNELPTDEKETIVFVAFDSYSSNSNVATLSEISLYTLIQIKIK